MTQHDQWVAVILAAGQGSRMRSALPKVAHPLAGRPIVCHVVQAARDAGVDNIVVVVGPGDDATVVRGAAGEGVRFAVQGTPLGTGDAVRSAREACGESARVLIMNGDVPLVQPRTLRRLMAAIDSNVDLALLTATVPVESYGFLELDHDRVTGIVETKDAESLDRTEALPINAGQYAARTAWLWPRLDGIAPAPNGEIYLTALAQIARDEGRPATAVWAEEPAEVRGINDRIQLAEAEAVLRERILRRHMLAGVTIIDPPSTFIDADAVIAGDVTVLPHTHVLGASRIASGCAIGPGSYLRDASIGERCSVRFSMIEASTLEADVDVGPYSHLRAGSYICEGVHIGNFAEVKQSRLGRDTKMGHFSYIGDAEIGANVNIGAGTITANYDGTKKNRTEIGDGVFIGSDTMLVAPVRIGANARTSAGSVVTRDVPPGMLAVGAPARIRMPRAAGEEEEPAAD